MAVAGTENWVSVTDAASTGQVSERTVWRWIHAGLVESRAEKRGQRETRLVNVESLPPTDTDRHETDSVRQRQTAPDAGVESQRINDVSHDVSPDAAGVTSLDNHRADLLEQERDLLRSNLEHQSEEISFLRSQLQAREDARREEMERVDREKEELRKLLAMSQHALQTALERPVLPPHVETPAPAKVRWWALWGRG